MKILTDWGFTREGWRSGQRGEYLVLLQGVLMAGFLVLPSYPLPGVNIAASPKLLYLTWTLAGLLGLFATFLAIKGFLDLGRNLTPLPYPREDGELVQSGAYAIVRHPLYSGLILAAFAWSLFQFSLSHAIATAILFIFFEIKSSREEVWLVDKYPHYAEYQQQVKKLIPWIY